MNKHRKSIPIILSLTVSVLTGAAVAGQSVNEDFAEGESTYAINSVEPAVTTIPSGHSSQLSVGGEKLPETSSTPKKEGALVSPSQATLEENTGRPVSVPPQPTTKDTQVSPPSVTPEEDKGRPAKAAAEPIRNQGRVSPSQAILEGNSNQPVSAAPQPTTKETPVSPSSVPSGEDKIHPAKVAAGPTRNQTSVNPPQVTLEENPGQSVSLPSQPAMNVAPASQPAITPEGKVIQAADNSATPPANTQSANKSTVAMEGKAAKGLRVPPAGQQNHAAGQSDGQQSRTEIPPRFTPLQQAEIEKIMSDYLVAHPEILVKAGETLQAQQAAERKVEMAQAAFANYTELTADPDTPSYGPTNAKVVVVTFFDYQSIWSRRLSYDIENVMKSNPDVKVVFKEWPIMGSRWPASVEAARTGLQIWKQKGPNEYLEYYRSIFALGHSEGELTVADIRKVSAETKVSSKKTKDVGEILERNDVLSHKIGFSGMPAVIVMPTVGGDVNTITVIPGYPTGGELQAAVKLARGG